MSTINKVALNFPEKTLTNEDFFNLFPEERDSKTWKRLGIKKRHLIEDDTVSSDLGLEAANKLFEDHPEMREKIDFIIYSCADIDYYTPTTAGILQDKLGISEKSGAEDIRQGCSCFLYLVSHADGLIQIGAASNVLVIAISVLTREIHENDKPNRFIFGDGACAFIVEKSEKARFHSYYFGNDGGNRNKIIVLDGENRNPLNNDSYTPFVNSYGEEQIPACFYQHGAGVFRFTLDRVPKMIKHILEQNRLEVNDIDLYLLHQPNEFIVENLAKIAGLPKEKVVIDVADYGNTVSVTIPTMIHNLLKKNQLEPGMKILVAAFGTGLSWNGCIWET